MILNAGDALQFSFTNISPTDGKRLDESLVLRQCLDFMNLEAIEAPILRFDASYFHENNYMTDQSFRLAESYYQKCDLELEKPKQVCSLPMGLERIDIDELTSLLAHPLRFFSKKSLGLYLESFEKEPIEAREFFISYAKAKGVVDRALVQGVDKTFNELAIQEQITAKPWLDAAKLSVQRKVNELLFSFAKLGIKKEDFFSHDVRVAIDEPFKTLVYGKVELLTRQGLVIHEKTRMQGIFKNWASIVMLNYLHEKNEGPAPFVCFTASSKRVEFKLDNPFSALQSLLAYYKKAIQAPSHLMANNIQSFMKGEPLVAPTNQLFHDPYTELLQGHECEFINEIEDLCRHINV